ncbi:MAG: hypothetical protein CVU71_12040 [Deltaproteobacteria bacterium HGW-Deltaproteobacteria-6]|nr:MAG: hypothetical protein CVU71_12040 [Deltaproteobacteria bacterium HGW-Deltaproteobacteria-6]
MPIGAESGFFKAPAMTIPEPINFCIRQFNVLFFTSFTENCSTRKNGCSLADLDKKYKRMFYLNL